MRFIFCIFLSVIGLVSFGETSKKLENGIYHNETSSKLIEIKNDTLSNSKKITWYKNAKQICT